MKKLLTLIGSIVFVVTAFADPPDSRTNTVNSTAYEASHVLKGGPGFLLFLSGYNSKASAQFIQVHDAASLPADGAAPDMTFTVAASSNFSVAIPVIGMPFSTGIIVCNSSTGPTKTIGAADVYFIAVTR